MNNIRLHSDGIIQECVSRFTRRMQDGGKGGGGGRWNGSIPQSDTI